MSQYNRESGTSGRNQYDITEEDLRGVREQQEKRLDIDFARANNNRFFSVVRNFPGLDAELNENELRRMAEQLTVAADKLREKNK